jgi:hypothetical protein
MFGRMVKPISVRIHQAAVTARARQLLRKLEAESTARQRFRHFAAKGFLAVSEMRVKPTDRDRWQAEVQRIESILLKISQSAR